MEWTEGIPLTKPGPYWLRLDVDGQIPPPRLAVLTKGSLSWVWPEIRALNPMEVRAYGDHGLHVRVEPPPN